MNNGDIKISLPCPCTKKPLHYDPRKTERKHTQFSEFFPPQSQAKTLRQAAKKGFFSIFLPLWQVPVLTVSVSITFTRLALIFCNWEGGWLTTLHIHGYYT
jgi:hypothetical protein